MIIAPDEIAGVGRCGGCFPLHDAPPAARALDHRERTITWVPDYSGRARGRHDFAGGTTFDLATTLAAAGTPLIFASGYGEELAFGRRSGDEIVIQKPYERDHLARAVEQALLRTDAMTG